MQPLPPSPSKKNNKIKNKQCCCKQSHAHTTKKQQKKWKLKVASSSPNVNWFGAGQAHSATWFTKDVYTCYVSSDGQVYFLAQTIFFFGTHCLLCRHAVALLFPLLQLWIKRKMAGENEYNGRFSRAKFYKECLTNYLGQSLLSNQISSPWGAF